MIKQNKKQLQIEKFAGNGRVLIRPSEQSQVMQGIMMGGRIKNNIQKGREIAKLIIE